MPKLYTYKKGMKQGYNVTLLPFWIFFFVTHTSMFFILKLHTVSLASLKSL